MREASTLFVLFLLVTFMLLLVVVACRSLMPPASCA